MPVARDDLGCFRVGRRLKRYVPLAQHLRRQLEKELAPLKDLIFAGPAPAPLARAESHYRYQIMLRTRQMTRLSQHLARLTESAALPEDVLLSVDIDPVNLA